MEREGPRWVKKIGGIGGIGGFRGGRFFGEGAKTGKRLKLQLFAY
jgi:hypothetical protein